MDDDRIERALRAAPPDEPAYGAVSRRSARPYANSMRWALRAAAMVAVVVLAVITVGPRMLESGLPLSGAYEMYKGGPGRTGEGSGLGPTSANVAWMVETEPLIDSSPVVADGTVVIVDGRGDLRALDLRSGGLRWTVPDGSLTGSPAIAGSRVVVMTGSGGLAAFELRDGREAWRSDGRIKANSSPLVMDGLIVAAGVDEAVHAFDAETGAPAWRTLIGPGLDRSVAGADGRVFFGGARAFHALDLETGASLWTTPAEATSFGTPAVRDGVVYAVGGVGSSSVLFAFDATTGSIRWRYSPPVGVDMRTPSVDDSQVYVASSDRVVALARSDGTVRWTQDVPRLTRAAIGVSRTTLYLFDQSDLIALDTESGIERWRARVGGIVDSGTTVVDGLVLAGTSVGRILAIGTPPD